MLRENIIRLTANTCLIVFGSILIFKSGGVVYIIILGIVSVIISIFIYRNILVFYTPEIRRMRPYWLSKIIVKLIKL